LCRFWKRQRHGNLYALAGQERSAGWRSRNRYAEPHFQRSDRLAVAVPLGNDKEDLASMCEVRRPAHNTAVPRSEEVPRGKRRPWEPANANARTRTTKPPSGTFQRFHKGKQAISAAIQ